MSCHHVWWWRYGRITLGGCGFFNWGNSFTHPKKTRTRKIPVHWWYATFLFFVQFRHIFETLQFDTLWRSDKRKLIPKKHFTYINILVKKLKFPQLAVLGKRKQREDLSPDSRRCYQIFKIHVVIVVIQHFSPSSLKQSPTEWMKRDSANGE